MKKNAQKSGFVLILLFLCPLAGSPQTLHESPDTQSKIDSVVNDFRSVWQVPGIALGIIKDNNIYLKKGYGYADVEKQIPVTSQTLFSIGSSTKSFTACGLAMLADEGKVSWEDPVSRHLPIFRLKNKWASDSATLIDILSHQTGLAGHGFMQFSIARQYDRREIVKRLRHLEFSSSFRTEFIYQNQMYQVATVLLEELSGKSWETLMEDKLFAPLQMNSTTFWGYENRVDSNNFTKRYTYNKEGNMVPTPPVAPWLQEISGSGSIYSNVDDLCNWTLFNLNKGTFQNKELVKEETMNYLHTPQVVVSREIAPGVHMLSHALGWDIMVYRGHLVVFKPGGFNGVTSQVAFLPDENIGIILLGNLRSDISYLTMTFSLLDVLLELEPQTWLEMSRPIIENSRSKIIERKTPDILENASPPTKDIKDYTGTYQHHGYGNITIRKKGDQLFADFITDSELIHYDQDVFQTNQLLNFIKLKFQKDPNGKITGIVCDFDPDLSGIYFRKTE